MRKSAWEKGVELYAEELMENYNSKAEAMGRKASSKAEAKEWLLNGAGTFTTYSYSGFSLCYNKDIAERLCNNTELKKTKNGMRRPNDAETWLDVQTRALYQAAEMVLEKIFKM